MRKKQSGQVSHRLFLDLRDIGYFGHITLTRWVFRNLLTKYIGLENVNFCLKTIFFNLWRNFQLKEHLFCWVRRSYFSINVTLTRILFSSVRSSSVYHGLLHTSGHFSKFFKFGAILPIYIHNSLSLSFSLQYTEQNQAILLHELHWQRMHVQISSRFYKVLQISLRPNMCYIF